MTEEQTTNQPTDQLMDYYSLRVTLPHIRIGELQEFLSGYTKNYCACAHNADEGVNHEHFHILILDIDRKTVEAMRKQIKKVFGRSGNDFFAGSFRDNHLFKGLQYVKHDANVRYYHRGSHWQDYIDSSPDFVRGESKSSQPVKRKRESDPMLTYSNVLWRARNHRLQHGIPSTDLGVVLEHMTRTTDWIPSQEIMRKGLDPLHHRLFTYQVSDKTGKTPDWWTPKFV